MDAQTKKAIEKARNVLRFCRRSCIEGLSIDGTRATIAPSAMSTVAVYDRAIAGLNDALLREKNAKTRVAK